MPPSFLPTSVSLSLPVLSPVDIYELVQQLSRGPYLFFFEKSQIYRKVTSILESCQHDVPLAPNTLVCTSYKQGLCTI